MLKAKTCNGISEWRTEALKGSKFCLISYHGAGVRWVARSRGARPSTVVRDGWDTEETSSAAGRRRCRLLGQGSGARSPRTGSCPCERFIRRGRARGRAAGKHRGQECFAAPTQTAQLLPVPSSAEGGSGHSVGAAGSHHHPSDRGRGTERWEG